MGKAQPVLTRVAEIRALAASHRAAGRRVALVPTMGYLHAGHLALIRMAQKRADVVITTIFVNPTQFGPNEDLVRYPRDPVGDRAKAFGAGTDALFVPSVDEIYGPSHQTRVSVTALSQPLCGVQRPGHFEGVCLVVLKLLNIVGCDVAIFGEKDYQQLAVIRQMVRDLNVPVEIVGHPIVREPDGLAMSSRNVYLSPPDREAARAIWSGLRDATVGWNRGERDPLSLEKRVRDRIEATGRGQIDYVDTRDAVTLVAAQAPIAGPVVLAVAVRFGPTRLIDNVCLGP